MFGYIRTRKADLRVREYEYYRASYCGLCRSMGKCTGQCSRLTLSYDVAFLANVRMLIRGTVPTFRRRRCLVHPLRRRSMMEPNEELDFCASAAALLAYEKCRDDVADEGRLGRFSARLRCLCLYGAYRRAKKRLPALAETVRQALAELSRMEAERIPSVDRPAAVFGRLLAAVCSEGLTGAEAATARVIGDKTGRFIYIVDAVDDMQKDAKSGNFNPVLGLFGENLTNEDRESLRVALIACLTDLEAALDLIPEGGPPETRAVLQNILYLGMPDTLQRVLYGAECRKEETTGE